MTSLRRLFPYVIRYRRAFGWGLACVAVSSTVTLLGPRVLQAAVDDLTAGVTRGKLALYGTLLLGIATVGGIFRFLMRRILVGASRHIEFDLRNDFFARLERMPVTYFQARRTGDLMSRATNDLSAVRMMIGPAVMYSANTSITALVAIVVMLRIDPWLTGLALLPLPILSVVVKVFGARIHREFERVQAQLSEVSAVVQESLSGVRVVRAYRQETAEVGRFAVANQAYVDRNERLIRWQAAYYPSMAFLLGVAALLVLWQGSRLVIQGSITVGELVAFNGYLAMLSWPMIAFGWVTNLLQRGTASWKRMLEVLDDPSVLPEASRETPSGDGLHGTVELRDLSFAYGETPVLRGISARVEPGRCLAIVGPTGSGKTTIVDLIARVHEPPPGTVFVDDRDVRAVPLPVLRKAIGYVPQEPFLFSDTLGENVAFAGVASEAGERHGVAEAAAVARLDKDVEAFPRGYDTRIGERGVTLSGGQRQRAAIARAVYADPRILILDDALSAVDTYTEDEILRNLRAFRRGRTTILISHRVSTVRDADEILVLDDGRVRERGRHDELIRQAGLYAELHRQQQLEEELAAS